MNGAPDLANHGEGSGSDEAGLWARVERPTGHFQGPCRLLRFMPTPHPKCPRQLIWRADIRWLFKLKVTFYHHYFLLLYIFFITLHTANVIIICATHTQTHVQPYRGYGTQSTLPSWCTLCRWCTHELAHATRAPRICVESSARRVPASR